MKIQKHSVRKRENAYQMHDSSMRLKDFWKIDDFFEKFLFYFLLGFWWLVGFTIYKAMSCCVSLSLFFCRWIKLLIWIMSADQTSQVNYICRFPRTHVLAVVQNPSLKSSALINDTSSDMFAEGSCGRVLKLLTVIWIFW